MTDNEERKHQLIERLIARERRWGWVYGAISVTIIYIIISLIEWWISEGMPGL